MGRSILVFLSVLSACTDLTSGRAYRIIRAPSSYEGWREKRQSHPLTTQVLIPDVAFADSALEGGPSTSTLLEIADYLTPPPPPADGAAAATGSHQQGDKWDLGFDANDILVPPAEQARQYDTLKIFTLVPNSAGPLTLDSGLENPEIPKGDLHQQDSVPAGSSRDEVTHPRQAQREQRHEGHTDQGPVYTYVKTDRHGHFKWGVRQGH